MGGGEVFYQKFFSKLLSTLKGQSEVETSPIADWSTSKMEEDLYEEYYCDDFDDMYDDYYDSLDDDEESNPNFDDDFSTGRARFVSPDWEIG